MPNIDKILKSFRISNSYSQKYIADFLGISTSAYNHYETGMRNPSVEMLEKLAHLYKLDEPLLGVYISKEKAFSPSHKYTVTDIYPDTRGDIVLPKKQRSLFISENQFSALCKYFNNGEKYNKKLLLEIAKSKRGNNGKLYEALVYAYLYLQGIPFSPQVLINAENCLKRNGYYADGALDDYCVFDVKMFGLSHPQIVRLKNKLNELCEKKSPDYYITIEGNLDVSNEVLEELLRDQNIDKIYCSLFSDSGKPNKKHEFAVPNTNLKITANCWSKNGVIFSEAEINPYKWAYENRYYFFHDASQFCVDRPYAIICPYDKMTAPYFTDSFTDSTMAAFRSLCRRIFFGMPNNEYAKEYDDKCLPHVSLNEASKCISAIIFQDVSMNTQDDNTWIFINPNATYKMPGYIVGMFPNHVNSMIDDFEYDNY